VLQIIQACIRINDDIYQHDLFMSSKYPIVITIFDVSPSATDDNHVLIVKGTLVVYEKTIRYN